MIARRMIATTLGFASLVWIAGASMQGQTTAAAKAATEQIAPAKAIDALLTGFEGDVMRAANAMPAEKYSFTPESLHIAGAKFDGVRTFAAQCTHLAQANYGIAAAVTGKKPAVDVRAISALKTKEEIIPVLEASFAAAHQAIATLTVANENDAVSGGDGASKVSIAAYIAVHGFDHYGQMVEYLRMNGIVPPPPPPAKGK